MTLEDLRQFAFEYAGEVKRDPAERLSFDLSAHRSVPGASSSKGWVYLWVAEDTSKRFDVCYVGKAGGTLIERCNDHEKGFKTSAKGEKHKKKILEYLSGEDNRRMTVYARKSPREEILGEADISMCDAEECAMISKLYRLKVVLWNKPLASTRA